MSFTVRRIPGTRRVGCRHCGYWSGPHRFWWAAKREARRHEREVHR